MKEARNPSTWHFQSLLVPKYLTICSGCCDDNLFRNEWLIFLRSESALSYQPPLWIASAKEGHLAQASNIKSTRGYKGPAPELFKSPEDPPQLQNSLLGLLRPAQKLYYRPTFSSPSSPDSAFFPPFHRLWSHESPQSLLLRKPSLRTNHIKNTQLVPTSDHSFFVRVYYWNTAREKMNPRHFQFSIFSSMYISTDTPPNHSHLPAQILCLHNRFVLQAQGR